MNRDKSADHEKQFARLVTICSIGVEIDDVIPLDFTLKTGSSFHCTRKDSLEETGSQAKANFFS